MFDSFVCLIVKNNEGNEYVESRDWPSAFIRSTTILKLFFSLFNARIVSCSIIISVFAWVKDAFKRDISWAFFFSWYCIVSTTSSRRVVGSLPPLSRHLLLETGSCCWWFCLVWDESTTSEWSTGLSSLSAFRFDARDTTEEDGGFGTDERLRRGGEATGVWGLRRGGADHMMKWFID